MRSLSVLPHPPGVVTRSEPFAALSSKIFAHLEQVIGPTTNSVALVSADYPPFDGTGDLSGSLQVYGIEVFPGSGERVLPPILSIGAWYLDEIGFKGTRIYSSTQIPDAEVVLVLADGSAKRSEDAPGYFDPRAHDFDTEIAEALSSGDLATLAELDSDLAQQLWCYDADVLRMLSELHPQATEIQYHEAPFGVGYWIAQWTM